MFLEFIYLNIRSGLLHGPLIFTLFLLLSVLTNSTNSPSTSIFCILVVYELPSSFVSMASEKFILPVTYELLAMGLNTSIFFTTTNGFLVKFLHSSLVMDNPTNYFFNPILLPRAAQKTCSYSFVFFVRQNVVDHSSLQNMY